jgi:hypothetical protein
MDEFENSLTASLEEDYDPLTGEKWRAVPRKLGFAAHLFEGFDWEEFERNDQAYKAIFKALGTGSSAA